MKFKQILKKALKYVFTPLALVGCIIGIYSLNTYAYSTNQFTNTISSMKVNNTNVDLESYTFTLSNSTLDLNTNFTITNKYVVLCNFEITTTTINLQNFSYGNSTSNSVSQPLYVGFNSGTYTVLFDMAKSRFELYNYSYVYIYNIPNNCILQNVDIILKDDLYLSYYYETYIQNLNSQIAQLQEDYDTLEGQYNTLSDNYNTLEDNYNTLEDNYNTLNNDYNNLTSQFPFYESNISNLTITSNSVVQSPTSENDYSIYKGNILQFDLRDFDYYNSLNTTGLNTFVYNYNFKYDYVLDNYSFYINLRHSLDEDINLQFYYNNYLSYQVDIVPESDSQQNNYLEIAPITFNKLVITFNIDYSSLQENRYISLVYSNSFSDGYSLGVKNTTDTLQPQIDSLNEQVESLKNEVLSKYNEGYYEGISVGSSDNNSLYGMVIRTL